MVAVRYGVLTVCCDVLTHDICYDDDLVIGCDVVTVGLCYDILIGRHGILFEFDWNLTSF